MKIRLGFVSNSSSTSYVIALTRDYKFSDDQISRILSDYNSGVNYTDQILEEDILEHIKIAINELCSNSCVYTEMANPLISTIYGIIKKDIDISEGGTEAGDTYINILSDANEENFQKIMETHSED